MSTAEKIVAAEAKAIELKDALTAESKSYEEGNEESAVVIDELIEGIDVAEAEVKRLRGIEERLKTKAVAVESTAVQAPGVHTIKRIAPVDRLVMNAAAKFESVITGRSFDQVIDRYAGSDDTVKAVASIVNKGAAAPAMTNVDGWAAELCRESIAEFMELLQPEAILPNMGLTPIDFGNSASIKIPYREQSPNLAGAFRAEGSPIRVGQAALGSKTLTPKTIAVISTASEEIVRRSTPAIMGEFRRWIVEDTSVALDQAFLSAFTGDDVTPAGLQAIAATPHIDGTGKDAMTVLGEAVVALTANSMGRRAVWVMSEANRMALLWATNAVGAPMFPELSQGTLRGYQVVSSVTAPNDKVWLVDTANFVLAMDPPEFMESTEATVHMEQSQADVLPIVDGTAADPVRSFYQTYTRGIRMVLFTDWAELRSGSVQQIDNVAW
jgi:HK97 family phage major capsid protein